ncbi:MAG: hypothetical protein NVSMB3_02530 [Acidobacteriaceae bacterium]
MSAALTDASLHQIAAFNAVDWLLTLVLIWSIGLAFLRGIIRELFGLMGTVLGLLLAAWNYQTLALRLLQWLPSLLTAEILAFLLIAVSVLLVCTLLGRLIRGTAHTIGLGVLDRLAGATFGLLRGAVLDLGILMIATAFFPPQALIANSSLAPYFLAAAREVSFVVPQDLQKRITGGITGIRHIARR